MAGIGYNIFLVSGLDKFDSFNGVPYSTYFFRFAQDLENADLIITMGFSFKDEHFNVLLGNALTTYPKKVIIVDKDPNASDLMRFPPTSYFDQPVGLRAYTLLKEPLPSDYYKMLDNLSRDEFCKLGPNSLYYNKGITEFMKEYQNIIQML
jgi:hypothetical protein